MTDIKEVIEINQVHDNDKYIVTRNTREELKGVEILKIYEDMEKALENIETQLRDMPKQMKLRMETLGKEKSMLVERLAIFRKHTLKLKDLSNAEKKKESISG